MTISIIIILILVLTILIIGIYLYIYLRNRLRNLSMKIFNTPNIMEGFKKQELEYEETPKSLSSLDSVLIPDILKDFPNLNIDEMKRIAESSIHSYYNSLNSRKLTEESYSNSHLNNIIKEQIIELQNHDTKYEKLKIHKTVINAYNNKKGSCVITFQSAIEYYLKENGKSKKTQARINVDMIYIYDDTNIKDSAGVSLNCKNCGAPIKSLGIKTCPYCSTGVVDYLSKVWKVNNIYNK